ncbi:MAG: hypothetical protein NTX52_02630, partial [Planctomycetota bacterium]|nr:hypothetical protein [Planctomycetota bacterium]
MNNELRNSKFSVRCLIFFYCVLMLGSGCASAPSSSRQRQELERVGKGDKNIVRSIEFRPAKGQLDQTRLRRGHTFKDKTLREKLDFKAGDYLDLILAESGRASLSEFYRQKGFPDARVTLDSSRLPEGKVIYTIDEGPRVKIRQIRFKGNKAIKTADLKKAIKIQTREWFLWPTYYTEEKIAAEVERLRNIYYQRGFLNHSVRAEGQG